MKKNIHFEFAQEHVKTPLVYQINRKFDVKTNIRGACDDEGGFLALELDGEDAEVDRVLQFLKDSGVEVADGLGSHQP